MKTAAGGLLSRLRTWFPDREFFMRSQGQVRFIKITSRAQMIAAGAVLAALVLWGLSLAVMGWLQYRAAADRLSLLEREATVAKAAERVGDYRADLDAVADDLTRRQTFIEEMVDSLPADARDGETVSDSAGEAGKTVSKVSALIPEAAALARIEARQLAFVEKLTRYADRRAERTARAIRGFGLDPNAMVRAAGRQAMARGMGGPLEKLATGRDGSVDPRFERLGLSLARMEALDRSLAGIPQYRPAAHSMTSSFGVRRDPFTGATAMHAGIDFAGPVGAPI
ncbi:MAG: M23 family metallopeptidase, partial [Cypionkella sp.]